MRIKNILALVLALLMLLSVFSACSTDTEPVESPDSSPSTNVPDDDGDDAPELETVHYYGFQYTSYDTGEGSVTKQVEDAINAITEKEIGVHVEFSWTSMGDYATQLTLAISNNEPIDLAHYWYRGNIAAMYAKGAAMDITDMIDEYAPDVKELLGWVVDMASFDGRVYGLPAYRQYCQTTYAIFRADNLETAGVYDKAKNMTTWSEMEEVLAAIVDSCGTYGLGTAAHSPSILGPTVVLNGDNISDTYVYETLADTLSLVAVKDGVCSQLWKEDGITEGMKMVTDWFDKGYIYPESAYSQDQNKTLLGMNTYGGMIVGSEYGAESNYRASTGVECLCVPLWNVKNTGSSAKGMGAFVPVSATNPTAALKLINLMYTNADLMNLWTWGIEGVSYVVEDGIAKYPEGKDNTSCGYHLPDYMIGNQYLVMPWDGASGPDFRNEALAYEKTVPVSDYAGFAIDISSIESMYAALTAAYQEFTGILCCGMYTDALYQEYMEKLDAAGVEDYVALYQTQLDDFLA